MTRTTALRTLAALVSAAPIVASAQTRQPEVYVRPFGDGQNLRIWGTSDAKRAVLGVTLAPARGRSDTAGVRISDVTDGSPAAKAGLEEGDRILSIDGTALRIDPADAEDPEFADLASRRLQRELGKKKPGDEVALAVRHDGSVRTVRVKTVAASELSPTRNAFAIGPNDNVFRFDDSESARKFLDSVRTRFGGADGFAGRALAESRVADRAALGLTIGTTGARRDTLGLFVSRVSAEGPAERAGIVEGARIASINGVDLRLSRADTEDPELASAAARRFTREVEKAKAGDDVTLRVWQNGAYRTVTVKAAKASDVWKGDDFSFSFGDGRRAFMPQLQQLRQLPELRQLLRDGTPPRVRVIPSPTSTARAGVRS